MGFLIDPPSRMTNGLREQVAELREFCNLLTSQLNATLNNLSTKNMDQETADAITGGGNSKLEQIQRRLAALENRGGLNLPQGILIVIDDPSGLNGSWSDTGTTLAGTKVWKRDS